jgi:hypothetical protein
VKQITQGFDFLAGFSAIWMRRGAQKCFHAALFAQQGLPMPRLGFGSQPALRRGLLRPLAR